MGNCYPGISLHLSLGDSLPWTVFHTFLFLGFFTHLYGVYPPELPEKGTFCKIFRFACLKVSSFHLIWLKVLLVIDIHVGNKHPSWFWKYCPRPSSFQCCCWEVQGPFNCWSLICDLFLYLGSCEIFLILKVMKFHNYGGAIFSFTVFGNHWASWTSKFMSSQFWKMFSPPCSLHSISEPCTVGSLGFLDLSSNFLLFIPFSTLSFLLYF